MNLEWKLAEVRVTKEEDKALTEMMQVNDDNLMKLIMESIFLSLKM